MLWYRHTAVLLISALIGCGSIAAQERPRTPITPGQQDALREEGITLYSEGRYEESVSTLMQVMSDSAPPAIPFYVGMSYAALSDFQAARPCFEQAILADPANTGYRFRYAAALEQAGSVMEAMSLYQSVLTLDSGFVPAYFRIGQILYDQKSYQNALDYFLEVIRLSPRDYLAYYFGGACRVALGENDSARPLLAACVTLNPAYSPALNTLGSIHYAAEEYGEALRLYLAASALQPQNPEFYYKVGLCQLRLGNLEAAIANSGRAAALDPEKETYLAQAGYCYLLNHQYDSAASCYRRAVAIDKENPLYYINLALAYSKLDSSDAAVATYQLALRASHPENLAAICIRLGTEYYYRKDYRNALAAYRQALAFDPGSREAEFSVALTSDQLTDFKSALRHYRRYLDLASTDTARLEQNRVKQARVRIRSLKKKAE